MHQKFIAKLQFRVQTPSDFIGIGFVQAGEVEERGGDDRVAISAARASPWIWVDQSSLPYGT